MDEEADNKQKNEGELDRGEEEKRAALEGARATPAVAGQARAAVDCPRAGWSNDFQ